MKRLQQGEGNNPISHTIKKSAKYKICVKINKDIEK